MSEERKWRKIMSKVEKSVDERSLDVGLENWRNQMKLLRRAGFSDEYLESLFEELEEYVQADDREKAEQVSKQMREYIKSKMLTNGGG